MLKLSITQDEVFNDETQQFVKKTLGCLELEHSLVSVSKWEAKYEKPFLSSSEKSGEELEWYIEAMILTRNYDRELLTKLTAKNYEEINNYLNSKQSATWFADKNHKANNEVITTEIIYYWMIALSIPFECQYWHLNRLLTLINVCNQKNAPAKKMSKAELAQRNRELNAQRRARMNTSG